MKLISIMIMIMVFASAIPAQAWRYHCYPRYGCGWGYGAAVGGAGAVGLLAGLLIGNAISNRNQAERRMLESAAKANQYENYITALNYYNANSPRYVNSMTKPMWIEWRKKHNLDWMD